MTDADLLRRILGAMRPDIPMDWHDQAWLAAKGLATLEAIEAEAATPSPPDVEARGGYLPLGTFSTDPPPMGEVLPIKVRPKVDMDATPAPLDVLYGFPKSYTEPEAAAWIAGARATLAATPAPPFAMYLIRDGDEAKL